MKLNVVSNATFAKDVATKSTTANPANVTIGGTSNTTAANNFTICSAVSAIGDTSKGGNSDIACITTATPFMNDTILPNANNARPIAKNKGIATAAKRRAVVAIIENAAANTKVAIAETSTCSGDTPDNNIIWVTKIPVAAIAITSGVTKAKPNSAVANIGKPNGGTNVSKTLAIVANALAACPIAYIAIAIVNTAVIAVIVEVGSGIILVINQASPATATTISEAANTPTKA